MYAHIQSYFPYSFCLFLLLICGCQKIGQQKHLSKADLDKKGMMADSLYDRVRLAYEISKIVSNRGIDGHVQQIAKEMYSRNTELYRNLTTLAIKQNIPVNYTLPYEFTQIIRKFTSYSRDRLEKEYIKKVHEQERWMYDFMVMLPQHSLLEEEAMVWNEMKATNNERKALLGSFSLAK